MLQKVPHGNYIESVWLQLNFIYFPNIDMKAQALNGMFSSPIRYINTLYIIPHFTASGGKVSIAASNIQQSPGLFGTFDESCTVVFVAKHLLKMGGINADTVIILLGKILFAVKTINLILRRTRV